MLKSIIFIVITVNFIACLNNSPKNTNLGSENHQSHARIKTVHGDIIIEFTEEAPSTVQRIKTLVSEGFYNGLTFHRSIPGKLIQTGDPTGTGTGGSGIMIKDEISSLSHSEGAIAMAKDEGSQHTADSQFFICLTNLEQLDGKYTIFAYIKEGLEAAKKIQKNDKIILMTLE